MHESHNAKQFQCPRCLAEQPEENVVTFSAGLLDCVNCGQRTFRMIYDDYYKALRDTRRRLNVDVHWRP